MKNWYCFKVCSPISSQWLPLGMTGSHRCTRPLEDHPMILHWQGSQHLWRGSTACRGCLQFLNFGEWLEIAQPMDRNSALVGVAVNIQFEELWAPTCSNVEVGCSSIAGMQAGIATLMWLRYDSEVRITSCVDSWERTGVSEGIPNPWVYHWKEPFLRILMSALTVPKISWVWHKELFRRVHAVLGNPALRQGQMSLPLCHSATLPHVFKANWTHLVTFSSGLYNKITLLRSSAQS